MSQNHAHPYKKMAKKIVERLFHFRDNDTLFACASNALMLDKRYANMISGFLLT